MREEIIAIIDREFGGDVRPDTTFEELGLDSLDFLQLVQCVRNEIGPISDEVVSEIETVGQLIEAVERA